MESKGKDSIKDEIAAALTAKDFEFSYMDRRIEEIFGIFKRKLIIKTIQNPTFEFYTYGSFLTFLEYYNSLERCADMKRHQRGFAVEKEVKIAFRH